MPSTPVFAAPRPVPAPAPEGAAPRPAAGGGAAVASGRVPDAIVPIGTAVVGVSGCGPAAAPLACRRYAVMTRYCSAPRFAPVGGIVLWMYSNRSRVVRPRHVFMKLL